MEQYFVQCQDSSLLYIYQYSEVLNIHAEHMIISTSNMETVSMQLQ